MLAAFAGVMVMSSSHHFMNDDDNYSKIIMRENSIANILSMHNGDNITLCDVSAESVTFSQIMAAIEAKEEVKRVRMAQVLHDLHKLAQASKSESSSSSENGKKLNRKSTGRIIWQSVLRPFRKKSVRAAVPLAVEQSKAQKNRESLFDKLTPNQAQRMIEDLNNGQRLDALTLLNLLRAAKEALCRDDTLIDLAGLSERIIVVGDLHGCLKSLQQVLEQVDINSIGKNTTIVFDGDFVDRGRESLEVMCILLLLKLAFPRHVVLLRGNHEDILISSAYGFQDEIAEKYADEDDAEDIFEAFGCVFSALPLGAVTENAAILHGGLPSYNFSLNDIAAITTEDRCRISTTIEPKTEQDFLVQGILWSDPKSSDGISPNTVRTVGVFFGPDVARQFLDRHNLQYLIRGHEVVDNGVQSLSCGDGKSVTTVFSQAAYPNGSGRNLGAYIELHADESPKPFQWKWTKDKPIKQNPQIRAASSMIDETEKSKSKSFEKEIDDPHFEIMQYLIASQSKELEQMFKEKAPNGNITPEAWAAVMAIVLELPNIPWLLLLPSLAPDHNADFGGCLDWKAFLDKYTLTSTTNSRDRSKKRMDSVQMELLKAHHEMLLTVFHFLDTSGNGTIDLSEFTAGVKMLNKRLPDARKLKDPKKLFKQIDVDGSGEIDVDEFSNFFMVM